jgi:hypothetical protein
MLMRRRSLEHDLLRKPVPTFPDHALVESRTLQFAGQRRVPGWDAGAAPARYGKQ